MDEIVFTPAAVLNLLTQIDELRNYNIGISEGIDGELELTVGNSIYQLSTEQLSEVVVDESTVEDVGDINMEAYTELSDSGEVHLESVTSGIIKELAKTLFVGGLVRLTSKLLK